MLIRCAVWLLDIIKQIVYINYKQGGANCDISAFERCMMNLNVLVSMIIDTKLYEAIAKHYGFLESHGLRKFLVNNY